MNNYKYIKRRKTFLLATSLFTIVFQLITIIEIEAAPGDLVINNLSRYQVIQRNRSDLADIPINGTFIASPCTTVEASFNGGSYATIDASPGAGTFSGTLSNQEAGQGTLTVRCSDNTSSTGEIIDFGIGDIFVIAGQSNARGSGVNWNSYDHPTLKATKYNRIYGWENGVNSGNPATDFGSPYPLIATVHMAQENVPFTFIETAVNGSTLVANANLWNKAGGATAYNNMVDDVNLVAPGGVKAILWLQGESDAIAGISQSVYNAAFDMFVANVQEDLPGTVFIIPASIGQIGLNAAFPFTDDIRLAIQEAWGDNPNVLPGPVLYDIGPLDNDLYTVHFTTDQEVATLAQRWWASINGQLFGAPDDGQGPILTSAIHNANKTRVILTFTDDSLPLTSPLEEIQGIFVYDDTVEVTVDSATIVDQDSILIKLTSAGSGTLTVSMGSQDTADEDSYFYDSSGFNLPTPMVLGYATSLGNIEDYIDSDGDGIRDYIEDMALNGDGNGEFIKDSLQAKFATVANTVTESYTTLEALGDCGIVTDLQTVTQDSLEEDERY